MINIDLNYNNAYKWIKQDKIYTIGYIFYQDKLYKDEDLNNLLQSIKLNKINNFLEEIDGCFSFVINNENEVIIISDLLRNFPVFYSINNDVIDIRDNIMQYNNKTLDNDSIIELSYTNYVTSYNTLFKNIYQLEAHQIVKINKNNYNITRNKYFEYKYNFTSKDDESLIQELDIIYDSATKKMIKYLNGRQAVIPLSGGNDSRLIAYYLTKNNYKNVISYTYGSKENSEIETSKRVADFLNIKWYFIEYKSKSMKKKFNNKVTYKRMADYCGRGCCNTHIQEWEAISRLLAEKIITKDSVILPGFTGDFLEGKHIFDDLFFKNKASSEQIISSIYKWQYQYSDGPIQETNIQEKLEKNLGLKKKEIFDRDCAIEIFEKFDFEERQAKYINNAIRTYDYQGLQWYLLFWDKKSILKWLTIPLEKRHNIKLFNKFTKTVYGDLMEYAPIYKKEPRKSITSPFKTLKKAYRVYEIYKRGFLNLYGYVYFRTYIKYALKSKNFEYNKIFSSYYIDYIKRTIYNSKS